MMMEAMRLSLLEHEQQQRKEEAAKKKKEADEAAAAAAGQVSSPGAGPSSQGQQQHVGTSTRDVHPAETPNASTSNIHLPTQLSSSSSPSGEPSALAALVGSASSTAAAIGSPASHSSHPLTNGPVHLPEPSSSSSLSLPAVSASPDSTEPPGKIGDNTATPAPAPTTPRLASTDSYISTTTVSTTATGESSQAYSMLPSDTDTELADDEPLIEHGNPSAAPTVDKGELHSSQ
jgi:hypothetical protein